MTYRTLTLTSPLQTGADVRKLQLALNREINAGLEADGELGELTAAAIKRYRYRAGFKVWNTPTMPERAQRILYGEWPLSPVEKGRAALRAKKVKAEAKKSKSVRLKALEIARGELGVREQPANSNSGPRVRVYQAATDLGGTGWPWCAAFVTWAFGRAGRKLKGFNQAYCPSWEAQARAGKGMWIISNHDDVRPGDCVLFDWKGDGVADHIGIMDSNIRSGRFSAIEANTSYGDDSNGGQVMRRDRNVSQVRCFIRVTER